MGINADNLIFKQACQDVRQAAITLWEDINRYQKRRDVTSLLRPESELTDTIKSLQTELRKVRTKLESTLYAEDPLKDLDMNAAKLLEVTRTWATFRDALNQRIGIEHFGTRLRRALKLLLRVKTNQDSLIEAILIGDQVVMEFYEIAKQRNLRLQASKIITVLREDRTHSAAFGEPTPFIVGPLWGYSQVWNYIAYAHEVGHHIYRNVDGLGCELLVNLMLTLGAQGYKNKDLRLWGAWLEEIFADLFCLLRVGPAAVHAGQRVALWIAATSRQTQPSSDTLDPILFTSRDGSHPVPYLRVCLGLKALRLLADKEPGAREVQSQIQELEDRWTNLAEPREHVSINKVQEKFSDLLSIGEHVITTILNMPLYALANNSEDLSGIPRSILEVFYENNRFRTENVDRIKEVIINNRNPRIVNNLLPKTEKWSILAATEFARDFTDETSLQGLHDLAIQHLR